MPLTFYIYTTRVVVLEFPFGIKFLNKGSARKVQAQTIITCESLTNQGGPCIILATK